MEDFSNLTIKDYQHWTLMLHGNQCHLGRCVLWCKREDADELSEISEEEQQEMFSILKELKKTLKELWTPDRMNYSSLANKTPHLHIHVLPRYKEGRTFMNHLFTDPRWGKNPYPYDKSFILDSEIVQGIKDAIQNKLT